MLVRRVIQESEIPRAVLARDSGLSWASLNAWISEQRTPTSPSLRQLAGGFQLRAQRLLELAEELRRAAEEEPTQ